ncbi:hypothetical protein CPB83DRAFT_899227 [Crepidotus variabilis]|uniref:Uncharacterized protein n=1 Tax=Crepidotus variabilis TaxID=179855 RepID=A0A9P6JJJ8_9AGAR|nr:hypothetical protein CPB83DRAFT_899227 [Crepidotus variabilis]
MIIAIFVAATFLVPRPASFRAPDAFLNNAQLSLAIEFISADPIARTIILDWYPLLPGVGCTNNLSKVIDIYVDPNILDSSSPRFTSTVLPVALPDHPPVYRLNITAYCRLETSVLLGFRTISKLLSSDERFGFLGSASKSIENYPFDVYFATFFVRGSDAHSGEDVKLNVTHSFGQIVNFAIDLHDSGEWANWLGYTVQLRRSSATISFVLAAAGYWLLPFSQSAT